MKVEETIFFTSCNSDYLEYAANTLTLVRKQVRGAKLAILGRGFDVRQRKLLEKLDILCIERDLSKDFYQTWEYPLECYYIFAGPEMFGGMGYKYSVYIDADVVCLSPEILLKEHIEGLAGVSGGECGAIFGKDKAKLAKALKLKYLDRDRIQSGVVYVNNDFAAKIKLYENAVKIFDQCIKLKSPRKGDDSLFAAIQAQKCTDDQILILDNKYNFIPAFNEGETGKEVACFHFTTSGTKPWAAKSGDQWDSYKKVWQRNWRWMKIAKVI